AVAVRGDAFDPRDALIWDEHVPQLTAEPAAALDHVATDDHTAAQPRADDGRDRRGLLRLLKGRPVPPQCAGVAVVEIADGPAEHRRQTLRQVEAGPRLVDEVGGAPGAEHALRARRARRVETNVGDVAD